MMQSKDTNFNPDFDFEDLKNEGERLFDECNEPGMQDPLMELIRKCKIDLSEILPPPPVAMQIMSEGKPITLFTKGNFSIVTGAAKSRKSFFVSMLMATAIKGSYGDMFTCADKGINILFDTEQSRYKSQQVAKRICRMTGDSNPDSFHTYSLRTLDPAQRMELIDRVLATTPNINFVAIDGIIDLDIDPILDAKQAGNIILKLMQWTEIYNIHIACVLHYNKAVATLLGHLGSFSNRKADAIIEVSKNKDDENVSFVKCLEAREKEFKPLAFSVDEIGMPYILEDYEIQGKASKKEKTVKPEREKITAHIFDQKQHHEILANVFSKADEIGYTELWQLIKSSVELNTCKGIGNTIAKNFLSHYVLKSYIEKVKTKGKQYNAYKLASVIEPVYETPTL